MRRGGEGKVDLSGNGVSVGNAKVGDDEGEMKQGRLGTELAAFGIERKTNRIT